MFARGAAPEEGGVRLRSLLFVPGDRPERFDKAAASGADALILDLEDSVSAERKAVAREAIAARLAAGGDGPLLFVRINPIDGPFCAADLDMLAGLSPVGIVLPKAEGATTIHALDTHLRGRRLERIGLLPIATETPAAIFALGSYAGVAERLVGLTWGAEDLPAAIGAETSREEDGRYTAPYEMVRGLTLFGAHAAGVPAIETVFPRLEEEAALSAYVARGRRDGFSGMMALHPRQVPIINAGFTPTADELARAATIVAAFAAQPGAGVLRLEGKMVDRPHLIQAQRILAGAN